MFQLAVTYHETGQRAKADSLHQKVFEIRGRLLDEDDPALIVSMAKAADMDGHMHRYARADSLFTISLERHRRVLGPEHNATQACTLDMAFFYYYSLGRYDLVEGLFRELLDVRRRTLGNEHPDTGYAIGNLADFYRIWRRRDLVEPLRIEYVELCRRIYGDKHIKTAQALNYLGQYYALIGRIGESDAAYDECLRIKRALRGPEDPVTLGTLWNQGWALREAGDFERGLQILEDVYAIRLRNTDDESTIPLIALTETYRKMGRYEDAERVFRRRIDVLEQVDRPALSWKQDLGRVYQEWGRHADAANHFETVLSGAMDETLQQRARLRLAQVYSELGRTEESRSLFSEYTAARLAEADAAGMNIKLRNEIALTLLEEVPDEQLDIPRVLALTEDIDEITGHTTIAYIMTHALALQRAGRSEAAVEAQRRALDLLHPQDVSRPKAEERLREFEAGLN